MFFLKLNSARLVNVGRGGHPNLKFVPSFALNSSCNFEVNPLLYNLRIVFVVAASTFFGHCGCVKFWAVEEGGGSIQPPEISRASEVSLLPQ